MLVRLAVALSAFIISLGGGLWAVYERTKTSSTTSYRAKPQQFNKKTTEDPLFYRTIGQLPQSSVHQPLVGEPAEETQEQFTLEIALLGSQSEAAKLVSELNTKGITAYYTPLQNGSRVVYRVRQGVYPNLALASKARHGLLASKAIEAQVVKLQ